MMAQLLLLICLMVHHHVHYRHVRLWPILLRMSAASLNKKVNPFLPWDPSPWLVSICLGVLVQTLA